MATAGGFVDSGPQTAAARSIAWQAWPLHDRRTHSDRRIRFVHSLLYGGLQPRRRSARRATDAHRPLIDWHGPVLFFSVVTILVLCTVDALLTLVLIGRGAVEVNPLMRPFVPSDPHAFAVVKLAATGASLLMLVAIARFRVFKVLRVANLVHAALVGYVGLVAYEVWLLGLVR
jgi:Domain of unknown function (DUF5658)